MLIWLDYFLARFGIEQGFILHEMSMGRATMLMSSGLSLPPQIKGTASGCGFISAWDIFTSVLHNMYHIPAFSTMQISNRMTRGKAGYELMECNVVEEVRKAKVPILFTHGDADTFVPSRTCHELYDTCMSGKSILAIEGTVHAEAYHKDTEVYEGILRKFLSELEEKED